MAYALADSLMNIVTEGGDFIESVWKAIPFGVRGSDRYWDGDQYRRLTPDEMLNDIWVHWDQVDISTAIRNIIMDQFVDAVIGLPHAIANRSWSEAMKIVGLDRPIGLNTGGRTLRWTGAADLPYTPASRAVDRRMKLFGESRAVAAHRVSEYVRTGHFPGTGMSRARRARTRIL